MVLGDLERFGQALEEPVVLRRQPGERHAEAEPLDEIDGPAGKDDGAGGRLAVTHDDLDRADVDDEPEIGFGRAPRAHRLASIRR